MEGELTEGEGPPEPGKEREQGMAVSSLPAPNHGGCCSIVLHLLRGKAFSSADTITVTKMYSKRLE